MPAQATPIASQVASNLSNVATSATRPTLENRLHDLDAAVAGLDRLVDAVGDRLSPILLAPEPSDIAKGICNDEDSQAVAWLASSTRRLEDVTAVLASIIERVQL